MRYISLLAVLLLAGCGYFSKKGDDFSCPKTGIIPFTRSLTAPSADKHAPTVAEIRTFDGDCSLSKDKKMVKLDLNLTLTARHDAADAATKDVTLPYFIAVLSPDEQILQRQPFSATLVFNADGIAKEVEEHEIKLPVSSPATAYQYKVVMGLALTPQQLQYNKEH